VRRARAVPTGVHLLKKLPNVQNLKDGGNHHGNCCTGTQLELQHHISTTFACFDCRWQYMMSCNMFINWGMLKVSHV